jgi:IclR family acetate operon transcriptional repressor
MGELRRPFSKAIAVLRWLVDTAHGSYGVREISAAMGAPVTTTHRALSALLQEGLVEKDEANRYALSLEAYRLGLALAPKSPWREVCLPLVRRAARETGETSAFSILDPVRLQRFTAARMESDHAVTVVDRGHWKPLHAGASGLALLAFLDEATQAEVLASREMARETSQTIVDPLELRNSIAAVRTRGYAITRGQRIPGVVGIAAPVFYPDGGLLGSMYVSVPEQRFDEHREEPISTVLLACCSAFTRQLSNPLPG